MRDRTKTQFVNLTDKFKSKMLEFSDPSSTNMIFTEDLKNMIHLAEDSGDDLDLVYKMMTRYVIKASSFSKRDRKLQNWIFIIFVLINYVMQVPDES